MKRYVFILLSIVFCAILYLFFTNANFAQSLHTIISLRNKPSCKDCNIMFVTIDSCGANNIQCYGYNRETMPNFCAYAKQNIIFKNAYANAPWTLPSHASFFTGLYPSNHHVNNAFTDPLSPNIPLLSDELHKNGYETIFVMPPNNEILSDTIIYNRGMTKLIDNSNLDDDGIAEAISALKANMQRGEKTFVSLYSQQCHYPYYVGVGHHAFTDDYIPDVPVDSDHVSINFDRGFYEYVLSTSYVNMNKSKGVEPKNYAFYKLLYETLLESGSYEKAKIKISSAQHDSRFDQNLYVQQYLQYFFESKSNTTDVRLLNYMRALYDESMLNLDRNIIKKLVSAFESGDLMQHTILIISAEHGEEFGEHGVYGHTTLFNTNIHIPLVMHIPGYPSTVVSDPVQSVDIMPTLLDLVGINNSFIFDGISLVPYLYGSKIPLRPIVADSYLSSIPTKTIQYGNWKVFLSTTGGLLPYMLYNISTDPLEHTDVLKENFSVANTIVKNYMKTRAYLQNSRAPQ